MPRHILHYRHGAEHVRYSDKLPYSVLAGASVAGAAIPILIRCRNRESRNRAGVVVSKLPAHIGFQRFILRRLTCGKLCGKKLLVLLGDLGILSLNTLRSKRIKHRTRIGVLVLNDVPRAVLDSLARVASLRSEVVVYALNCFAGLAAAIGLRRGKTATGFSAAAALTAVKSWSCRAVPSPTPSRSAAGA